MGRTLESPPNTSVSTFFNFYAGGQYFMYLFVKNKEYFHSWKNMEKDFKTSQFVGTSWIRSFVQFLYSRITAVCVVLTLDKSFHFDKYII